MTLNRIRRAISGLVSEDRDGFKHVDATPAHYSLSHRRWNA
jgi:hypothetical protein